ncbi:UDP-glucose pyrophosphorylase [Leptomonas pyrrhocoris]|uniref:UTP--glucose-1-phosphate uridylyltransferase n=1 Tax=Leptomonas pyrrhocoris TaxID=157538 RepID=A0A0M9FYP5_LEPPY|nr:UDP-glucose pyrophosphorylase [Leptomonas pyrrhocoris]KPA78586.1 UDP-glucose pyrophosphorylase [Leptomonas pyrrhocoris]|eukprot:XP_015657025.1 UDP-glucose pyrophosphorylase [Leptomonas pyrrhocoris]
MSGKDIDMKSLSAAAQACVTKMQAEKVNEACIRTFLRQHEMLSSGATGSIPDSAIKPVEKLDSLDELTVQCENAILESTVVLKLNGGLGTGMGLHDAKTLLEVKDGKTFLDFTAMQMEYLRKNCSSRLRFMLMDSFSTSASTKAFMKQHYPWLYDAFDAEVELMQNQVPKVLQDTLEPATWPTDPSCEWAPPGHGDLYTALYGSGKLRELLRQGYRYLFVSNGDNLGATLDSRILAYMENNAVDFLMEVCQRTESDKKGGHLALQTKKTPGKDGAPATEKMVLLLRESAQCPEEDMESFQDIRKYSFFNTNNLWISLPALMETMEQHGGTLPLPVIRNEKTVDPSDSKSPKVFQLETAMGAAIAMFDHASAIVVPRSRFAPVKTCADLLALRSDAYVITPDSRLVLDEHCNGRPPVVDLDSKHYKLMKGFSKLVERGVPSMVHCKRVGVKGLVQFGAKNVLKGEVKIENPDAEKVYVIPDGTVLENTTALPSPA